MSHRLARVILSGLALAFVFTATPATAELPVEISGGTAAEAVETADGSIRHSASGFIFPARLGDMPARKIVIYSEADVSVYYTLYGGGNGDAWITFYVYPGGGTLEEEAGEVAGYIRKEWNAAELANPPAAPPGMRNARIGWFTGQRDGRRFTTGFALARRSDWSLKARFSIPAEANAQTLPRTIAALSQAPWHWFPTPPQQTEEQQVAQR